MAYANSSRQRNCLLVVSTNKKTLAVRLSAHLDRSGTSNRAKQMDRNPRLHEARQCERRKTDHNRHISPSLEPRTIAHKKPRQRRSTAAARQREQVWQWRTQSPPAPTSNRKPPARFPERELSLTISFAYLDQKAERGQQRSPA